LLKAGHKASCGIYICTFEWFQRLPDRQRFYKINTFLKTSNTYYPMLDLADRIAYIDKEEQEKQ